MIGEDLQVTYRKIAYQSPLGSSLAYFASFFVLPGRELPYVRMLLAAFSLTYLFLFLLGTRRDPLEPPNFQIRCTLDTLTPTVVMMVNHSIALVFPVCFMITGINAYFAHVLDNKRTYSGLLGIGAMLGIVGVSLPFIHPGELSNFAVFINIYAFLFCAVLLLVLVRREKVIRARQIEIEASKVAHRQIEHDIRNLIMGTEYLEGEDGPHSRRLNNILDILNSLQPTFVTASKSLEGLAKKMRDGRIHTTVPRDFTVYVVENSLVVLLWNLINNSFQSGATRVILSADSPNIKVMDNGPGFNTSTIAPGHTTKSGGTGTTLSEILPELASLWNIQFEVQSSSKGTTIVLDFTKNMKKFISLPKTPARQAGN